MSHVRPRPPSGILRQLLARLQPVAATPAAASLAFMMLAPAAALAQTPTASETTLPTVKVEDTADPMEVNNGYQGTQTRVGKTLQDPQDIPQAITTVTRELMEDQQVGSLREALRNVSGLTFNAAEGGRAGDNMMLRGFYTFGDLYLDGIRDTAQYNRETFNLEQVDVLRGSASMLFGRGQAGGVINLVSKTPKRADAYTLTGSVGTDNYTEVTADLNKRVGENAALRVNLMKRDEGSWRENPATGAEPEIHRSGAAVSLALGMQTDDEFVFSHQITRNRDIPDYGFSFDNATHAPNTNFPPEYFLGHRPQLRRQRRQRHDRHLDTPLLAEERAAHHRPLRRLRAQLLGAHAERDRRARLDRPEWRQHQRGPHPLDGLRNAHRAVRLQHPIPRAGHEARAGHRRRIPARGQPPQVSSEPGRHDCAATRRIFQPYVESTTASPVNFTGDSYAVYVQDTVEFMPFWKATLGVRRDELKAEYSSLTSPQLDFGEWSLRSGLSYQPTDEAHYYLSFSDSFSPTADLYQLSGDAYPRRSAARSTNSARSGCSSTATWPSAARSTAPRRNTSATPISNRPQRSSPRSGAPTASNSNWPAASRPTGKCSPACR